MENNQATQNKTWIPWVLGILLAVALTAICFMAFSGEKPVVTFSDQNGIITGTVKSPSVDASFISDQPKQIKEQYETRLQEERKRTEKIDSELKEERTRNVAGTNSTLKEISGKIDETNKELKNLTTRVGNVENGIGVLNNSVVAGFNTVNTNLVSIDKSVISVKKEVKRQGRLTREEIKNVFKSIPRSQAEDQTEDEEDTSDWPAGAKK
jgi:septal ring factor EnvC (AmiA/AmiB activator)